MLRWQLIIPLVLVAACGPQPDGEQSPDPRDAPFATGKADGAVDELDSDVVGGVLELVNDLATTAALLDAGRHEGGVGLDRRAARNIVHGRPFASLDALDAVPYVGPRALEALRRFACEVRALCEPELVIASWNLQQFPLAEGTLEAAAREIARLDADVVAIQEVADADAFQRLADALPEHEGLLAEPGWYTGVGLLFRRGLVRPLEVESLFTDDSSAFPRPALRLKASVGSRVLTFIVVHLKAQVDAASQARRRAACKKLEALIDTRPGEEIVVLGDFNDRVEDAPLENVFTPFLSDPANYVLLTQALAEQGAYSYVAFRSLIDHIVVTDEVLARRKVPETFIPRLDLELEDYRSVLSDHLPVVSRLRVR